VLRVLTDTAGIFRKVARMMVYGLDLPSSVSQRKPGASGSLTPWLLWLISCASSWAQSKKYSSWAYYTGGNGGPTGVDPATWAPSSFHMAYACSEQRKPLNPRSRIIKVPMMWPLFGESVTGLERFLAMTRKLSERAEEHLSFASLSASIHTRTPPPLVKQCRMPILH
jgi:hypothetical protein